MTNLRIYQFFEGEIGKTAKKSFIIKIELHTSVSCKYGTKSDKFVMELCKENIRLMPYSPKDEYDYIWSPKSHMRDFEAIDPFGDNEIMIARGQGVGIIIIESLHLFVKLMFDKESDIGIKPVLGQFGPWNRKSEDMRMLSCNLSSGYDILLITDDGKSHHLCEKIDERDSKKTIVMFSSLNKYADYKH